MGVTRATRLALHPHFLNGAAPKAGQSPRARLGEECGRFPRSRHFTGTPWLLSERVPWRSAEGEQGLLADGGLDPGSALPSAGSALGSGCPLN